MKRRDVQERDQIESDSVPLLQIYVASHCPNCEEALRLANVAGRLFPKLRIEIVDLDQTPAPPTEVFAVPTYVLNGCVCFLGNPSQEELYDLLVHLIK